MATLSAAGGPSTSVSEQAIPRPRRQQACMLCQQRKVKCDHKAPCATCVKARVHCIPAQTRRRRKRRFPERELLDRLRKYEDLLTQHNISFDPLHPRSPRPDVAVAKKKAPESQADEPYDSEDDDDQSRTRTVAVSSSPALTTTSSEGRTVRGAKRMLHTLNQESRDPTDGDSSEDEVRGVLFKRIWDQTIEDDTHLLFGFGSHQTIVDTYTLHPQPFQIFQLWQLYLDNVDPLLKITHTHSLQKRIIEAAPNVLTIKPELEALMFGIYCMAITSLTENDCRATFASSKVDLLAKFQLGCQQALLNSRFMRTTNHDCLAALYLYLFSVRPTTAPQSLSSMLGTVTRIGERMGIHSESILVKYSPLEAEIGRRLWWSLMLFDARIGEMADLHATSLLPTWDCRTPLTVNDSDLREEMKEPPQVQGRLTDVIFVACRSELADFVRHTKFHLGFFAPGLRSMATESKGNTEGAEMDSFSKMIEDKYLKFCDPENALHFMTIWTTRGNIAKYRLVEHHFRYSGSSLHQAETQRDAALSYALRMLECNTKLMTSPLTKGFIWMVHSHFPFIGYIQIIQYLKWRPTSNHAAEAWEVMNDNYQALLEVLSVTDSFFKLLTNMILQAWEAREMAYGESGQTLETPPLVSSIRHALALRTSESGTHGTVPTNPAVDMEFPDYPTYYDIDMDHLDWSAMNWDLGRGKTGAFRQGDQHLATNAII
ncbi:Transcription factor [Aspergillus sclerotialis]|uniref:Transcription factor n=1 Tax=Aspergillus sclerotialis TaxID=2070753 RepID=A0A3A2ZVM0_9EURO|nr:Transcription factor [Aspergillus sclerotialis]